MKLNHFILAALIFSNLYGQPPDTSPSNAGVLKQATGDVTLWGAKPNDGVDDRAAIQAAIDAGNLISIPEGQFDLAGPLVVDSGQTIKAHSVSVIKRMDDTVDPGEPVLLVNENPDTGDENITIDGGIWDFNGPNNTRVDTAWQPQTGFRFKRVQNLQIRNLTLKDPLRFSTLLTLCTNGIVNNITFDQEPRAHNGDGIHCNGCIGMTVENLRGNCGDDMVNFATGDSQFWQDGEDGRGPNLNNTVRNVYAELGSSAVRVLSFDNDRADNILIENIRGTFDGIGIFAAGRVVLPDPNYGKIIIRDIQISRSNANQTTSLPVIGTDAAIEYLEISDVSRGAEDVIGVPILTLFNENDGNSFGDIVMNNIRDNSSVDRPLVIVNAPFKSLTLDGVVKTKTTSGSASVIDLYSGFGGRINISNMTLRNVGQVIYTAGSNTFRANISNLSMQDGSAIILMGGGSTATAVHMSNVDANGLFFDPIRVDGSRLVFASFNGLTTDCPRLVTFVGTGTGTHRVVTSNVSRDTALLVTGTNSVSFSGTDTAVDKATLTPLDGDQVRDATGQIYNRVSGAWVP